MCNRGVACATGIQEHWKSLKTDQFLQVQGTGGSILALGDAATVSQVLPSPLPALPDLSMQNSARQTVPSDTALCFSCILAQVLHTELAGLSSSCDPS